MNMSVDHIPTTGSVLGSGFAQRPISEPRAIVTRGACRAKKTSFNPRQNTRIDLSLYHCVGS
jgi:hypothetical protein